MGVRGQGSEVRGHGAKAETGKASKPKLKVESRKQKLDYGTTDYGPRTTVQRRVGFESILWGTAAPGPGQAMFGGATHGPATHGTDECLNFFEFAAATGLARGRNGGEAPERLSCFRRFGCSVHSAFSGRHRIPSGALKSWQRHATVSRGASRLAAASSAWMACSVSSGLARAINRTMPAKSSWACGVRVTGTPTC